MKKYSLLQKVMALALTLVMVVGMVPGTALAAEEASVVRTADASTINEWKGLFTEPDVAGVSLSTENAGGIWTDKSVFEADSIPAELTAALSKENTSVSIADEGDNFLVALSAVASNKEITGYSTIPTDTVFILDLSSSMRSNDDNNGSALDELVDATNKAIADLLELNKNNRVGVVLYAGNTSGEFNNNPGVTTVLMPIDSYTTNKDGQYLETYDSDMGIRTHADLRNSNGQSVAGELDSARGTFTQDGIYEGMKMLLAVTDTAVESGVQAGADRMPIMVLMTDGEPTMANNDYNGNDQRTDLGTSNMYLRFNDQDYNHRYTIAFMTQLTAAFAKREVSQHYGTDALMYTLAYGEEVNRLDEAMAVMDPEKDEVLNDFWTDFLAGEQVTVFTTRTQTGGNYWNPQYSYSYLYARNDTAEPLTAADKLYVDEFFPAESDDDLFDAFQSIVDEIIIQSKYYPTYVEDDHDHDGYVTFADKIGAYMDVKDVKGIVIGDHYYSGATLAKGVVDGSVFGTVENPTEIGDNLVWSIKERLNIADTAIVRQLLKNAYDYGQFSYTSDAEFSNYIGWYSDANGNYLDFWHEGITTAAPANATHIIKSYLLLGETDPAHGVSDTDMLYASIRVTQELIDADNDGITGETIVTWKIPASLVPTITYQVSVEVNNEGVISNVNAVTLESSEVAPIRLLYEVGLRDDIHDWNIAETVNDAYRDSTANKDDGYVFYSNQWNKEGTDPERQTTRNTYSHFEPSVQNERYYYTEDSIVYTDKNGSEYTGASAPSGTFYRAYQVFEIYNGQARMHTHYEKISSAALEQAEQKDGHWIIPKGTIHRYYDDYRFTKDPNTTDTMDYYFYPMIEVLEGSHYYSAVTLGNNGKLTLTPATGIKVSKAVTETVEGASDTFTFVISGGSGTATLIRLDAEGNETSRETLTFAGGKAEFTLKDGETVYIIGLSDQIQYTVSEKSHEHYSVASVKVDGVTVDGITAQVKPAAQNIHTVDFTNEPVRPGSLFITKEVVHAHEGEEHPVDHEFDFEVTFVDKDGNPIANTTFQLENNHDATLTELTTDAKGVMRGKLKHGETVHIFGIPAGAVVTVKEVNIPDNYTSTVYRSRNHSGETADNDGVVTIAPNQNATVVVTNTYTPKSTSVDLNLTVEKILRVDTAPSFATKHFYFDVEKWTGSAWERVKRINVGFPGIEIEVNKDNVRTFEYPISLGTFTEAGVYTFQVYEVIPDEEDRVPGMTYDRTVYTLTVTVTDVNGQLVAEITDKDGKTVTDTDTNGIPDYKASFTNEVHSTTVDINIEKNVEDTSNNPLTSKAGFEFVAQTAEMDANGDFKVKDGGRTFSVFSDGAGKARMTDIYKEPGTYCYIISEKAGADAGWSYDATQYWIKVEVTKDETTNDLTASMTVIKVDASGSRTEIQTSGDSASLDFANTYDPADAQVGLNTLVKKNLEGRDLVADEFTFAIFENGEAEFNANGELTNIDDAVATGTNDADGNVTFTPEKLTFKEVGKYEYDVIEVKGTLGGVTYDTIIYDLVVEVTDNGNGTLKATYFYEDDVDLQVQFNNTYTAQPTGLTIPGEKKLTGRPMVNAEFRFTLTQVTDATGTTKVQDGLEMTVESDPDTNADGTTQFAFTDIEYTQEDVGKEFFYLIEEVNTGLEILGVTHNPEKVKYVVKVTVTDNGNGTLTASYSVVSGGQSISFNNVYVPKGTSADVPGTKELTGRLLGDGEFEFTLTEMTDDTYATVKQGGISQTVKNTADGTIPFAALEFDQAGDYYFLVEETEGLLPGIAYDEVKYRVHIEVVDNHQGQLLTTTHLSMEIVTDEGNKILTTGSVVFHNIYTQDDDEILISGSKTYNGGKALENGVFEVGLYDADGNLLQKAEIKSNGTFAFVPLPYTAEDVDKTFTYTVKEIIPDDATDNGDGTYTYGNHIYDAAVFTVVVTVKDEVKDGVLEITKTVDGTVDGPISFTNTFVPDPIDYVLKAKKTYEKGLKGEDFKFTLVSADDKTDVDQTKKNDADGIVTFDKITFPEAGTYTFHVEEIDKVLGFIQYSTAKYLVTIQVVNENGVLRVVEPIGVTNLTDNSKGDLTFVNTYKIDGEGEVTLRGSKVLTGDRTTVNEGEFEFGLYDEAGNLVESVKNDANGNFQFSTLKFDEAGVSPNGSKQITYTIREIPGSDPNMTYDTATVYTVVVTVKDNDQGGVDVSYTVNGKPNGQIAIVFTNTFTKPADVLANIYIRKQVINKTQPGIGLDGFEFVLEQVGGATHSVISNAEGRTGFQITLGWEHVGQTYTFKVYEKKGTTAGITYDATVYTVTVTVGINPDGTLKTVINGVDTNGIELAFTNIYEKSVTPVTGDNFPVILVGCLVLISGAAVVVLMLTKKKKTGKYER